MTREELKEHCEKQIEMCEMWAVSKGEKPSGEIYEEHKLILELLEQEPSREFEDYENEIEDLHNRLDIAEYDKERLREEVTILEAKIKALEQEPCEDAVSRQIISDYVQSHIQEINTGYGDLNNHTKV